MPGTMKMFCIRMNILSHRNNTELFLACNMAAMQNLYNRVSTEAKMLIDLCIGEYKYTLICFDFVKSLHPR